MYVADVFPLHKILHLWDKLMLGDSSYPLFIGIAILRQLRSTLLTSGFNECILLFSDLPDIVMDGCVLESQKMYEATPKSITHRQHALRLQPPQALVGNEQSQGLTRITIYFTFQDIGVADVELKHLQQEQCPRISAKDVQFLLDHSPAELALVDLRSVVEFGRVHVPHSINIPFATVQLGDQRLEALQVPQLETLLRGRIVVCVSNIHQHSVEVGSRLTSGIADINPLPSLPRSSRTSWWPAACSAPASSTRASTSCTPSSQIYSSRIEPRPADRFSLASSLLLV